MGGVFITLGVFLAVCHYVRWPGRRAARIYGLRLIGALAYGLIGLIDDLIIVLEAPFSGAEAMAEAGHAGCLFAVLIAVFAYQDPAIGSKLCMFPSRIRVLGSGNLVYSLYRICHHGAHQQRQSDGRPGWTGRRRDPHQLRRPITVIFLALSAAKMCGQRI